MSRLPPEGLLRFVAQHIDIMPEVDEHGWYCGSVTSVPSDLKHWPADTRGDNVKSERVRPRRTVRLPMLVRGRIETDIVLVVEGIEAGLVRIGHAHGTDTSCGSFVWKRANRDWERASGGRS